MRFSNFVILCFLLMVCISCSTTKNIVEEVAPPTDQMLADQAIDQAVIKKHLNFLASDEMAGRNTPSMELHIAGRYLANELESYGVQKVPGHDSYFQTVPMVQVIRPSEGEIIIGDTKLNIAKDFVLFRGPAFDNVDVEYVYANRGAESDYENVDVAGKVVVVSCGLEGQDDPRQWFGSSSDKRKIAKRNGAIGLVELYANQKTPFNFMANYFSRRTIALDKGGDGNDLFHAWVNAGSLGEEMTTLKGSKLPGVISVDGMELKVFNTRNVLGYLKGTDPVLSNEYVVYGAHYDHVGIGNVVDNDSIYNGARDNGVGTASILCLADHLSKHPTKRSALFIFFTGEEKGLLGSEYYANHPWLPMKDASYCFNSDNAGYNDTTLITIFGLGKTTGGPLIEKAASTFGLKAIDDPAPEQGLFDRSDNVNFARKGVPAPTFSMGFDAFDSEIFKYYHQPSDEPSNISYTYLEKFYKTYLYAARLIANTPEKLFWTEGDKYYDAGVQLYGKD